VLMLLAEWTEFQKIKRILRFCLQCLDTVGWASGRASSL